MPLAEALSNAVNGVLMGVEGGYCAGSKVEFKLNVPLAEALSNAVGGVLKEVEGGYCAGSKGAFTLNVPLAEALSNAVGGVIGAGVALVTGAGPPTLLGEKKAFAFCT